MDYGITNNTGKISNPEIKKILKFAVKNNIDLIDTAQSYGNSESLLGDLLPKNKFHIISKVKARNIKMWNLDEICYLNKCFFNSLDKLKVKKIEGLLLHNSKDLLLPGNQLLLDWLKDLQTQNLINRIGVSVYSPSDLNCLPLKSLQIIQIPLSIYDQRFMQNDYLSELSSQELSIFVRSSFLQGLLLQSFDYWPDFLSSSFKLHHEKFSKVVKENSYTLLQAALGFVLSLPNIESVIVGVSSFDEFYSIYDVWKKAELNDNFFYNLGLSSPWSKLEDIDPRFWPSK